jgi:hypothetical protein
MSIADWGSVITGVTALVAVPTAVYGLRQYRDQTKERRGRWLHDLSSRFAQEEAFRAVRRELYGGEQSQLVRALRLKNEERGSGRDVSLPDAELDLLVALDDYLDFFALIAHLIDRDELDVEDAAALFSWYVSQALAIPAVRSEVENHFEAVVDLARRFDAVG